MSRSKPQPVDATAPASGYTFTLDSAVDEHGVSEHFTAALVVPPGWDDYEELHFTEPEARRVAEAVNRAWDETVWTFDERRRVFVNARGDGDVEAALVDGVEMWELRVDGVEYLRWGTGRNGNRKQTINQTMTPRGRRRSLSFSSATSAGPLSSLR